MWQVDAGEESADEGDVALRVEAVLGQPFGERGFGEGAETGGVQEGRGCGEGEEVGVVG